MIGQLPDAIEGYTAVLKIDSTYVPALKGPSNHSSIYSSNHPLISLSSPLGRAEGYYGLALESLEKCFDGKAVDLISAALMDLTMCVHECLCSSVNPVILLPQTFSFLAPPFSS